MSINEIGIEKYNSTKNKTRVLLFLGCIMREDSIENLIHTRQIEGRREVCSVVSTEIAFVI